MQVGLSLLFLLTHILIKATEQDMAEFLQQLLNALVLGSVYCLVASGLTLVYGIMHVPNFAQGNLYMAGAYLVFLLGSLFAHSYWVVFFLTIIGMGAIGIVVEMLCFRPVRNAPHVNSFVIALGVLMAIEGLVVIVFGADYKEVKPPWEGIVKFWGVSVSIQRILVCLGTLVVMVILQYFLKRTKAGMSLEAMSQNRDLALMVGINVNRMSLLAFAISTALAGVGGALMAPVSYVYPAMGMTPLLIAFAAVIFGGMGNLYGAVLGSFIMAGTQVFSTQYLSAVVSDIAIFGIMIAVLVLKPEGILGSR
jgi:branched-chain amino acid transport system permease protein